MAAAAAAAAAIAALAALHGFTPQEPVIGVLAYPSQKTETLTCAGGRDCAAAREAQAQGAASYIDSSYARWASSPL